MLLWWGTKTQAQCDGYFPAKHNRGGGAYGGGGDHCDRSGPPRARCNWFYAFHAYRALFQTYLRTHKTHDPSGMGCKTIPTPQILDHWTPATFNHVDQCNTAAAAAAGLTQLNPSHSQLEWTNESGLPFQSAVSPPKWPIFPALLYSHFDNPFLRRRERHLCMGESVESVPPIIAKLWKKEQVWTIVWLLYSWFTDWHQQYSNGSLVLISIACCFVFRQSFCSLKTRERTMMHDNSSYFSRHRRSR